MISRDLQDLLTNLDLIQNQVVFFFDKENGRTFTFSSKETEKKLNIIQPTAFYLFNNQPYILFFDLADNTSDEREEQIHKQVWSFDQSPLVFIIKYNVVEIFNAFSFDKKTNRLQKINVKQEENKNEIFSFWNLLSGTTWDWLEKNYYKNSIQKKRVNQKLFENIKLVREALTDPKIEGHLKEDEVNILILRLIFIRYLIDRNVKLDTKFIEGKTILERKKSFGNLISNPRKLNNFFERLNERFNGVLFKNIKVQLSKYQAQSLALVFNGEKPEPGTLFEGTDFYFEIFDFSIIPVEVISGIYESLIDEETKKLHSAVYTPSFLVEYILSNTIDVYFKEQKNKHKTECKIFDPSVGSGIFLVQSFRRMVDREISLSKEQKISKVRLREIAQTNLFGIDLNEQALKVACFSIYIAILDYRDPNTILDNFHFPKLIDENLFGANFFDTKHSYNEIIKSKSLDFILGNPPWKSNKEDTHTNWLKANNKVTGRYEIAQSFLLRSKEFMQSNTLSALIVTSTIFYNVSSTTKKFKQEFLRQFCMDSFFDLSPVRRLIFEEKNSPCSIVFYRLSIGENYLNNIIKHQSVKSNIFLKYYKTIVIEKFDQKKIKQKHFIENDWMFKVALYGNTLDFILLKKLEQNKTKVIDLIDNKTVFKGAGILEGNSQLYPQFLPIIDKELIENNEVLAFYTKSFNPHKVKPQETYLKSGRIEGLFNGLQILFKEQAKDESDIVISLTHSKYVFKKGIFGISSVNKKEKIKELYALLISNLYTYFIYITSGSWGVSTRPQIRWNDEYLSFPYIQPNEQTQSELLKLVNRFLTFFQEHYKTFNLGEPRKDNLIFSQINSIVEELYQIKGYEKDLIDYVLEVSRYQFQESKQYKIVHKIHDNKDILKKYADVFLKEFKDIYKDEYLQVLVYPLDHFIAMHFLFSEEKPQEEIRIISDDEISNEKNILDVIVKSASISKITKDLYVQKDIKGFEENSFYIIKPNEFKCWHRAMAWYDVAEIKETIEQAEIDYLKKIPNAS